MRKNKGDTGPAIFERKVMHVETSLKEVENDRMLAALKRKKSLEDDYTVTAALMPKETILSLENDCMLAVLNPINEMKLKLKHKKGIEDDCTVVTALMLNKSILGLENDCTILAALSPVNESELKLSHKKGIEDDCMVVTALMPDKSVLGLEND